MRSQTQQSNLDLGIIGNGTINALIDGRGRIAWHCVPAFDPACFDLLEDFAALATADSLWRMEIK
jgi:hypothetical protein